jgi:hypothetical protein
MVVTPSFTHMSITFSNQRFSFAVLPWKLDLWNSRLRIFVEEVSSDEYSILPSRHPCCCSSVIFLNSSQCQLSLSVIADFRPLFLFADDIFPWFVYADITLETVALDTPYNVAVFVTDASAICLLSTSDKSPIFQILSHGPSFNTIINSLTLALQSVNKLKTIQCCHLKFFRCNQRKLYSSVS